MMTFSHPIMTPLLACSSREKSTNKANNNTGHSLKKKENNNTGQRKNKHPISHA